MASLNELELLVAEYTREFRTLKEKAAESKVIGEPVAGGVGLVQVDITGGIVGPNHPMQQRANELQGYHVVLRQLAELVPMGHVVAEKGDWEVRPAS